MFRILKHVMAVMALTFGSFAMTGTMVGCDDSNDFEDAGEDIDDAIEDAGDNIEDATDN